MQDKKTKTVNGFFWSIFDNYIGLIANFIIGIILARLLSPSEFGLMGMIVIVTSVSVALIDSGLSQALIRRKKVENSEYNTTFIFSVASAFFLYLAIYFLSPHISSFFNEDKLVPIIRVSALSIILQAFFIVHRTILIRIINFKIQAKATFISSLLSGLIGVFMAFSGYGIWSLVVQVLSRQLFLLLFFYYKVRWLPKFEFSYSIFKELYSFGYKILLSGLLFTISKNMYYVVIGRYYSPSSLGQYTKAESFNSVFTVSLTNAIQRVTYPILSTIQNDNEALKTEYKKIIQVVAFFSISLSLGISAISEPLVLLLIGEQWAESIIYLQILCIAGVFHPLININLNVLKVKNRPDLFFKLEILRNVVLLVPNIFVGIYFGIIYMLWGYVLICFFSFLINGFVSSKIVQYSLSEQIKDMLFVLIVSIIVSLCMYFVTMLGLSNAVTIFIQVIIGISMYLCIYEFSQFKTYCMIKKYLINNIAKYKAKKK